MWRVVCALALVTSLVRAQDWEELVERPPDGKCVNTTGDEYEFNCPLSDGNRVIIKVQPNEYVKIDCQGGTLRCEDIVAMNASRDGSLKSMSVRGCAVTEALGCALARLGASRLGTLSLWDLRTPLAPDHVRGLDGLKTLLMFESGVERSIPMQVLSSLPSLHHYRLQMAHVSLAQFPALPLRILELSMDDIQELPPDMFHQLTDLTDLYLWGNKYTTVGNMSFTGLSSLQTLSLSSSTRHVARGALRPAARLQRVELTRLNLDTVQQGLFTGLQHLEKISLSNDLKLTVEPRAFAELPALTELKLDRSTIHALPPDAFSGSSALASLSLAFNKLEELPSALFKDLKELKQINLSENKIKALPADLFAATKKLDDLNLDGNDIEHLPSRLFAGLAELKTISINNNHIKTIADDAFRGPRRLRTLRLSHNQLTLQPTATTAVTTTTDVYKYDNVVVQSPFRYLMQLRELDLSYNNISFIFDDWLWTLVQLETLDLTYNKFTIIESRDTGFLSLHLKLDLRHNNISSVELDNRLSRSPHLTTTGVALLEDNPINCDCHLYGVTKRRNGFYSLGLEIKLDFGDATCVAPKELRGTKIINLKPDQLICEFSHDDDCPDSCQCDVRPATDTLELLCDKNVAIPENFNGKSVQLQLRSIPSTLNIPNVEILKLNGLGMNKLPEGRLSTSIQEIDLRNNSFTDVPVDLIKMERKLYLSGNKFDCDCSHADQLALLIKYQGYIQDFDNVTCSDGLAVSALDTKRLCAQQTAAVVGGTLALIGVVVAVVAVLFYRYSLEVRVWLFARGWCRCLLPEESLDRDKRYDVFLSFAHGDEKYVNEELLPILDNEYRVCIHYRDWIVGDMIPTQIARSVESSRRTIIVLSQKFLESIWAKLEFRAAHMQAVSDRRARVVVILLQDVTDYKELDDELKAYLNTNTYVKWGDPWFWDKLRYVLPRSGSKQRVAEIKAERKTRQALDKFASYGLDVYINEDGKLCNAIKA